MTTREVLEAMGLDPVTIQLPDFTSGDFDDNLQQLELDTIRGYNGYAGLDRFGFHLHEFRVWTDPQSGLLILDLNFNAMWQQVPASDRPPTVGDPGYVERVLHQDPRCGG
jgi:hypothetical protein